MTLLLRLMEEDRAREGTNINRGLNAKDNRSGRRLVGGEKKLDEETDKFADDVLIFGEIRIPVNIVKKFISRHDDEDDQGNKEVVHDWTLWRAQRVQFCESVV